ncbi:hypothetical protein Vretimale_4190 [Volvox reticuliferus]|uniref:Uncharacterized protein n=2 Tax=Volvox reticuliferus TaxID=1737510 RepID=A0A8J4DBS4_9CHLO|nr:hypothetical protein Vretimale_4190 [Volvox reticuliferus]
MARSRKHSAHTYTYMHTYTHSRAHTHTQGFLSGPHTLVRVDASLESMPGGGGGDLSSGIGGGGAANGGGLLAGPGSPQARRTAGGGGFGLGMVPRSPPSAHKTRGGGGGGRSGKHSGGGGGGLQSGLSSFFRQAAKCLACKQALPMLPQQQQQQQVGAGWAAGRAPGLCAACCREPDTLATTYLRLLEDDNTAAVQLASALSSCMRCHSGGRFGPVLCENGECGVLFARLGAARRLAAFGERLERLDVSEPPDAAPGAAGAGAGHGAPPW